MSLSIPISEELPKEAVDANAVAFSQALQAAGFDLNELIQADGEIYRCHVNGDKDESLNGWYSFHGSFGWFGNWKNRNLKNGWRKWVAKPEASLSGEETAHLEAERASLQAELTLCKEARHKDAQTRAQRLWDAAQEDASHPYLVGKGLAETYGTRRYKDMLLVPLRSPDGTLQTLLRIWPDGAKKLLSGGKKQGGFFVIGELTSPTYLCEGFATGASIHEATGCGVVVCGDCDNLVEVAKVLKATYPNQTFVSAGDNDRGKPINAGLRAAKRAAELLGADYVAPDFSGVEGSEQASDFNDLMQRVGIEAVRHQLEHNRQSSDAKIINGLLALDALDYRRALKHAAKTLGVSMGDVDKEVSKARARQWAETLSVTSTPPSVDSNALQQDAREVLEHNDPLALVNSAIKELGYGGDTRLPHLLYLSYSSRLLTFDMGNMLAHAQIVGAPSSGKNYVVDTALALLPQEAYLKFDAGSPKALIYCNEDLRHRIVVFVEADSMPVSEGSKSLADGDSRSTAASALRNLASDGYLSYHVVERDSETGQHATRLIRKEGPTLLITTTTKAIGGQMGTRLWEMSVLDTDAQVNSALYERASLELKRQRAIPAALIAYQSYLQSKAPWDVIVFFAKELADGLVYKGMNPRILRDFQRLLALIKAVTILRHPQRQQDDNGRWIAEVEDYEAVYRVLNESYATTVNQGLTEEVKDVITAVKALRDKGALTITYDGIAKQLGWYVMKVSRKAKVALTHGWLVNQQTKPRQPADLIVGEVLPEDRGLPSPERIRDAYTSLQNGCYRVNATEKASSDAISSVNTCVNTGDNASDVVVSETETSVNADRHTINNGGVDNTALTDPLTPQTRANPSVNTLTAFSGGYIASSIEAGKTVNAGVSIPSENTGVNPPLTKPLTAGKPVNPSVNTLTAFLEGSIARALGGDETVVVDDSDVSLSILRHYRVECRYLTTQADAQAAVQALLRKDNAKVLGLDTETTGLDIQNKLRLIQIYDGERRVYLFDLVHVEWEALKPLWARAYICHNASFDGKFLLKHGSSPVLHCTKLMARLATGRIRDLSLKALAKEFLNWDLDKAAQVSDWSQRTLSPKQLTYAALDAVLTTKLAQKLKARLEQQGQLKAYLQLQPLINIIAKQELQGCPFDADGHNALVRHWMDERNRLEKRIYQALGDDAISIDSGHQLGAWLEKQLPEEVLAHWPRTSSNKLKTDKDTLALYGELDIIKPLLEYKHLAKRLSVYGHDYQKNLNPITGRLHPSYFICGTAVGKFSSSKPNLMQLPRDGDVRALVKAPAGRVIVCADFNQLELRIGAELSQDDALLQAYRDGVDVHTKTASVIAGVPLDEVTKHHRQGAKALNFGLLFGQGAKGLARYARASYGVSMTVEEAQRARDAFFAEYRGLRQWQLQTDATVRQTLKVYSKTGRVRDFALEGSEYKQTEALNSVVASGAADILVASLIRLDTALQGVDAQLIGHVHDEILIEASEESAELAKRLLAQAMIDGFSDTFPDASTKGLVEVKAGQTWAEAK